LQEKNRNTGLDQPVFLFDNVQIMTHKPTGVERIVRPYLRRDIDQLTEVIFNQEKTGNGLRVVTTAEDNRYVFGVAQNFTGVVSVRTGRFSPIRNQVAVESHRLRVSPEPDYAPLCCTGVSALIGPDILGEGGFRQRRVERVRRGDLRMLMDSLLYLAGAGPEQDPLQTSALSVPFSELVEDGNHTPGIWDLRSDDARQAYRTVYEAGQLSMLLDAS
jgi:hypothetical protein